jgi:UDP-N-acetylglucosamine 4,6-dehydratase
VIQPAGEWVGTRELEGAPVPEGFSYTSDGNDRWLNAEEMKAMVKELGSY